MVPVRDKLREQYEGHRRRQHDQDVGDLRCNGILPQLRRASEPLQEEDVRAEEEETEQRYDVGFCRESNASPEDGGVETDARMSAQENDEQHDCRHPGRSYAGKEDAADPAAE